MYFFYVQIQLGNFSISGYLGNHPPLLSNPWFIRDIAIGCGYYRSKPWHPVVPTEIS